MRNDDSPTEPKITDKPARVQGTSRAFRAAAAWSWRALLIGALVYFAFRLAARIGLVVLALFAGLLITALIRPVSEWLVGRGVPRLAGAWISLLALLVVTALVLWYIVDRAVTELASVQFGVASGLERLRELLVDITGLPPARVDAMMQGTIDQVTEGFGTNGGALPVMQSTAAVGAVLAALGVALFSAFWFVYDGSRVWQHALHLAPLAHRALIDAAGQNAWNSLEGYLRGVTLVALVDATGIGLALLLLDVPMPLGLAALTFIGAFVPLVGALLAGLAAVLVALATHGITTALLTLGAVILVQQLEGQLLSPLIMGRSVRLHPLVIAYSVAIGGVLYGLAGAVLAVPLAAGIHAAAGTLRGATEISDVPARPFRHQNA